jgi:hypothetical protein
VLDGAFFENYSLTSVTLPQSLEIIRGNAFHLCSELASITIPSGVTAIIDSAFSGCRALTSIRVEAVTPPSVTGRLFSSDLPPESLTAIYVPVESVTAYKNADVWKKHASLIKAITP